MVGQTRVNCRRERLGVWLGEQCQVIRPLSMNVSGINGLTLCKRCPRLPLDFLPLNNGVWEKLVGAWGAKFHQSGFVPLDDHLLPAQRANVAMSRQRFAEVLSPWQDVQTSYNICCDEIVLRFSQAWCCNHGPIKSKEINTKDYFPKNGLLPWWNFRWLPWDLDSFSFLLVGSVENGMVCC